MVSLRGLVGDRGDDRLRPLGTRSRRRFQRQPIRHAARWFVPISVWQRDSAGIAGSASRAWWAAGRAGQPLQVGFLAAPQHVAGLDCGGLAAVSWPGRFQQPHD
jgi:hypothetical protein